MLEIGLCHLALFYSCRKCFVRINKNSNNVFISRAMDRNSGHDSKKFVGTPNRKDESKHHFAMKKKVFSKKRFLLHFYQKK